MKWISVDERLPKLEITLEHLKFSNPVLGVCFNGKEREVWLFQLIKTHDLEDPWWHDLCDGVDGVSPTHWMPIPPFPKETP